MNAIDEIKQDAIGLAILQDWLGDGCEVVPKEQAEARAKVCLSCPHNVSKGWWWKHVKDPIATAIRSHIAAKRMMELEVENEDRLWMCGVCGCAIPTVVWTPIDYIEEHTPYAIYQEYPEFCWKKREMKAKTL